MLTRAVLVLFLLSLVRASKLSLQLQARQDLCDSRGGDGYCNRVCGDIYLPVSQFCCGTVPASSFYYESSIGQVCNDYCINNNDYLARYSNGTWSCDVATPFPSTSYIPSSTTPTQTLSTTLPSTACGPQVQDEGYGYRSCCDVCLSTSDFSPVQIWSIYAE